MFIYYDQCSYYACVMLLGQEHFLQSSRSILISECSIISLQSDCSIREYQFKELYTMNMSVNHCSIRQYQSIFMKISSIV